MRSPFYTLSAILLSLALLISLGGCQSIRLRFWENPSPEDSAIPKEFSAPDPDGQANEDAEVFPISLVAERDNLSSYEMSGLSREIAWRYQTMSWLDRDRLALVLADGIQSSSGSVIMAKALLLHWQAGEEASVITLPDATVNRIEEVDNTLFFYDDTTIYRVDSRDFSLIDTASNATGSAASGDLLLRRDDSGVMLRDLTEERESIRIARNDDSGIYGDRLLWSPDGQRFLITRQNVGDLSGNGLLIGSREGKLLQEVDIAGAAKAEEEGGEPGVYDFTPYWSADSRSVLVADSSTLRSYSAFTGESLARVRNTTISYIGNIQDVFGNWVIFCRPTGNSWYTVLLDLSTGEAIDLLETPHATAARFSPDGNRIAAVETEDAHRVYLIRFSN